MTPDTAVKTKAAAAMVHLSQKARELLGMETLIPIDNGMGTVVHAMKFR